MSLHKYVKGFDGDKLEWMCPNCHRHHFISLPEFLSCITVIRMLVCVDCWHYYKVELTLLDYCAVEQRDEAAGEGAGESPKTLRTEDIVVGDTCPRCRGAGHYVDYIGKRECSLCNGTGQVSPSSTR